MFLKRKYLLTPIPIKDKNFMKKKLKLTLKTTEKKTRNKNIFFNSSKKHQKINSSGNEGVLWYCGLFG
jgi:hypothetical protein